MRTPRRSRLPGLVAAEIDKGASRTDAVTLVAKSEHTSERAVRRALADAERNPVARRAEAVYRKEDGERRCIA